VLDAPAATRILGAAPSPAARPNPGGASMPKDSLTITDNRTGRSYELPIEHGAIRARDLAQIRVAADAPGLASYDPAFVNTASCKSRITYIDGDRGVLLYRGYPIEQLAERSTFLETAYLLIKGELPPHDRLRQWTYNITLHTIVHENIKGFMDGFRYDAHPMGMLVATVGALSTFYPDAKRVHDDESRRIQTHRLIAKMPTLAAFAYRHSAGMPYAYPDNDLSYAGNFLNMMFKMTELKYRPDPVLEHALDVLFILHADHEQNCSTNAMRSIGSSQVDPFSAQAGACAALYGPLHGGANEAVLRMLMEIGSVEHIPAYIKRVKAGEVRLMGFGHRVYKNFDPRGKIIKRLADEVFEVTGRNPLLDIALELERIALQDDYFVGRKLYPNVDFYSGIIYQAMSFPIDMFPVLFAIARTAGWIAQWLEMVQDEEQRIARPKQVYLGSAARDYVPVDKRATPDGGGTW
jgi:citrate synthase